jgi:hypothetical protein
MILVGTVFAVLGWFAYSIIRLGCDAYNIVYEIICYMVLHV